MSRSVWAYFASGEVSGGGEPRAGSVRPGSAALFAIQPETALFHLLMRMPFARHQSLESQ